jgi:hypothetical protein
VTPEEAATFIAHWDALYRVGNGSIDLLLMSQRMPPETLRKYIEASRIVRKFQRGR